jgi:hypothetical protein
MKRFFLTLIVLASVLLNITSGEAVQICSTQIAFSMQGHKFDLPYAANMSLFEPNADVDRMVVLIPGVDADANLVFNNARRALNTLPTKDRVLLIVPQFLHEKDTGRRQNNYIAWKDSGWSVGRDSSMPSGISSFEILDEFIVYLIGSGNFPNVKTLVIGGHSAGGQFVNRYAAGGKLRHTLSKRNLGILYVISNPSSYLYFDERRPRGGVEAVFVTPDTKLYPDYDNYRYGLKTLPRYMRNIGRNNIINYYKTANIRYILGENDDDENAENLSQTSAAILQGRNRLERGKFYYAYTLQFFNKQNQSRHRLDIVSGAGHSSRSIYGSDSGKAALFIDEVPAR